MDQAGFDWRPVWAAAGRSLAEADRGRRALARAHHLLVSDPAAPWDVAGLAAVAGYSPAHFLRRYAAVYGLTPARDLTRHRLLAARDLLETTDLSVSEVCQQVGFTSLGSFSARFRHEFGRPPSHWRRHVWRLGASAPWAVPVPSCFLVRHAAPLPG